MNSLSPLFYLKTFFLLELCFLFVEMLWRLEVHGYVFIWTDWKANKLMEKIIYTVIDTVLLCFFNLVNDVDQIVTILYVLLNVR